MKTTQKATKQVIIIARYSVKRNNAVIYLVRSAKGDTTYTTTLINGKATGCSCPAQKPCYHMVQLEAKEQARFDKSYTQAVSDVYATLATTKSAVDDEYNPFVSAIRNGKIVDVRWNDLTESEQSIARMAYSA